MILVCAIAILEKAQKNNSVIELNNKENDGFWSFLNPFKCGKYD